MAKQKKTSSSKKVDNSPDKLLTDKYMPLFEVAWKAARQYFDRANKDAALFDQKPNMESPTLSDISLAGAKLFVDQAMPANINRMFGSENPFEFIPPDKKVTYDQARKTRDWVLFNMLTVMNLETEGYLTLKDSIKFGVGYGIIEPKLITPGASEKKTVFAGDEEISTFDMEIGEPIMVPSYTYIPFGQVIPTPDGKNPDEVSCVFVLRFYPEDVFKKMLDKKANPNTPYKGNFDEIVKYARSNSMDGYLRSPRQIAAQIANTGRPVNDKMNIGGNDNTPVSIPVLQCYARNEHVWFACDRFPVYHKKSKFQTLRPPIEMAQFDPDGNSWFTPGIINPRRGMIMGTETFYNAIMDILTMHLHPHQITNTDAIVGGGESPNLQPYGRTNITGPFKANEVVSWATPPALPPYLLQFGDKLEEFSTQSVGQPKSLNGQGTAGLVRGGSGAMESLMQSSSGREKLTSWWLERSWYKNVVEHSLILCQMLAEDKVHIPQLNYDPATGKNDITWLEITKEDIRHIYKVQLSFDDKMSNQLAEMQKNAMIYDRGIKNRFCNPRELFAMLVGNTKQFNQITEGVDAQANQAAMEAVKGGAGGSGGNEEMSIPAGAGTSPGGLPL